MAVKWRILLRTIETKDTTVDQILKAIVGLHNFLIEFSPTERHPARLADTGFGNVNNGLWRNEVINPLASLQPQRGGARIPSVFKIRDNLMTYLSTVGSVPWQDNFI
jgi:hypothetical protein